MKLDKDFQDLLSVFNAHNVRYLVVGGMAFSFHAEPRGTKDADVWIEASRENGRAVYQALAEYGAPIAGIDPDEFFDGKTFFQFGVAPNRVDIMQAIEAVEFSEAWPRRQEGRSADGVSFHVISKEDLIVNKSAVGRLQDLADVERLRDFDD